MPDFGLNVAQILGAVGTGRKKTGGLPDSPFLSRFWLSGPWCNLEIIAQTDVKFQICFKPGPARQTVMPRQESLSPVWSYLMASEAVCWAVELWRLIAEAQWVETLLIVAEDQDLDIHPTMLCFSYLFRFGHLIHQNYHTHFSQQRLVQFGSIFYLLENQRVPLAVSSFVVCERSQLFIDFLCLCL